MSRLFVLLFCINMLPVLLLAQNYGEITGVVMDENKNTLPGASVVIHPTERGTITDVEGRFNISQLKKGIYQIEVSFIGYIEHEDTIKVDGNCIHNVHLKPKSMGLHEVVITDNYLEKRKKEQPLNIEVVNDEYLKQNLGGSLMGSLERLPGVSTIAIGSGQSKPIIRGLGFNRVVVIENNIKHEAQQWGADHGLEIDQYAVDHIEVIKGPASLMYGSDAIGGVIDLKNRRVPCNNTLGGTIDLTGKTNNDFLGTSVSLYGRKKWFFADVRATIVDYGDYKVPTDSVDIYSYRAALYKNHLRNTAGYERNFHVTLGVLKERFQSKIFMSSVNSKSGFFANAHGMEPRNVNAQLHDKSNRDINYPYQKVNHFKLSSTTQYEWDKLRLEIDAGFQRNYRQERSEYVSHGYMPPVFPDTLVFSSDLERQFDKHVYSGNLKSFYKVNEKIQFNMGLNCEYQDNKIDGRGFIIPAFNQFNGGIYAFANHAISDKNRIQIGVRYDYGNIDTEEYYDWFQSPVEVGNDTVMQYLQRADNISRNFSNISWSVGYNYFPNNWVFKVNVGKSYRMPTAKELAANGVNYHHFSYEVGDADLSPEVSYQFDAGIEYNSKYFAVGTTPFLNYFSNYIYLNPSSEHDRLYGNGNQIYYYTQCRVLRYGGEFHAHYKLLKSLQLGVIGEYVYSEQVSGDKKGFTLPFSPPPSAIFNLKYQKRKLGFIGNGYLSIDYRITAPQNNIVPPEETTEGYQVINVGLGGDLSLYNQKINISMQVKNLLNAKYFNHTSYYRLINVPEPGRNVVLNISIPFSGKITKNNF